METNINKIVRRVLFESLKPPIIFSAVLIEEPSEIHKIEKLVNQFVPNTDWKKPHDYHMTINLGKLPQWLYLRGDLNKDVTLKVHAIGVSEDAIALAVSGYYTKNDNPHITIAFKKGGEPANSKFITDWKPIGDFDVTGIIREFTTGNKVVI